MRIPPWYWFRHEKDPGAPDQALRVSHAHAGTDQDHHHLGNARVFIVWSWWRTEPDTHHAARSWPVAWTLSSYSVVRRSRLAATTRANLAPHRCFQCPRPGHGLGAEDWRGVRSRNQLCLLLPKFPGSWLKETSGRGVDPPEVKGSQPESGQAPRLAQPTSSCSGSISSAMVKSILVDNPFPSTLAHPAGHAKELPGCIPG